MPVTKPLFVEIGNERLDVGIRQYLIENHKFCDRLSAAGARIVATEAVADPDSVRLKRHCVGRIESHHFPAGIPKGETVRRIVLLAVLVERAAFLDRCAAFVGTVYIAEQYGFTVADAESRRLTVTYEVFSSQQLTAHHLIADRRIRRTGAGIRLVDADHRADVRQLVPVFRLSPGLDFKTRIEEQTREGTRLPEVEIRPLDRSVGRLQRRRVDLLPVAVPKSDTAAFIIFVVDLGDDARHVSASSADIRHLRNSVVAVDRPAFRPRTVEGELRIR